MQNFLNQLHPILRRRSIIVALIVFLLATIAKLQSNAMPSNAELPTEVQPSPNARSYFDAASLQVNDELGNVDTGPSDIPGVTTIQYNNPNSGYYNPPLSTLDKMVQESEPAFSTLEGGLKYQFGAARAVSYSDETPNNMLAKCRNLARCLRFSADDSVSHEDYETAIRYRLDCIDLGAHLEHGSSLTSGLVGFACENIGLRKASTLIDHLTAQKADDAAARISAIDQSRPAISQILLEEKWTSEACLLRLFKYTDWRRKLTSGQITGYVNGDSNNGNPPMLTFANLESPRFVYSRYASFMDAVTNFSRLPWPEQLIQQPPVADSDRISQYIEPVFTQLIFKDLAVSIWNRLLETQLALHAYKLEHGAYPQSLQSLTGSDFRSVPLDPFTDGKPLCYRLKPNGDYILYSVGPDAVDNGGTPSLNPNYNGNPHSTGKYAVLEQTQTGDIVAGVNE